MSSFATYVENLDFKSSLPPLPLDLPLDLVVKSRTHTSLLGSALRSFETAGKAQDYQRLEHLGDKMIGAATTMYLFNEHLFLTCGAMTTIAGLVVSNNTLSAISRAYNLHQHLRAHPAQISSLRNNSGVQADLFEALVGSIYVNSGTQAALDFATSSSLVVYGSYDAYDEYEEDCGPGDIMLLEEWKMQVRSRGRDYHFERGPSIGLSNVPHHSGSLVVQHNGVTQTFGPIQGIRGQKYKIVQQRLAHAACEYLGLI
ncbi:ribonuclease III domain-containing protein [Mrakia frigida]|uniref:ribonuclease III domain-containing protein n=1 Tax=Mrakia frigida TaxID=29902 RepID=UPI003FCC1504